MPARFRPFHDADCDAAAGLTAAAGWPHRPDDWRLLAGLGCGVSACDAGGEVLGTALWWAWGEAAATLGMIVVAPPLQGRGIGRRLTEAVIEQAGGRALQLVATAAGRRLYASLGFEPREPVVQHHGVVESPPAPPGAPVRAYGPGDREAVLALDCAAFGAPRTALLDRLLDLGECAVVDGRDGVTGFAIRRRFGRGDVIGPLVASGEDDAAALVAHLARAGFLRIDVPGEAPRLRACIEALGLAPVDTVETMVRGPWAPPADRVRRFGLVGQALG